MDRNPDVGYVGASLCTSRVAFDALLVLCVSPARHSTSVLNPALLRDYSLRRFDRSLERRRPWPSWANRAGTPECHTQKHSERDQRSAERRSQGES